MHRHLNSAGANLAGFRKLKSLDLWKQLHKAPKKEAQRDPHALGAISTDDKEVFNDVRESVGFAGRHANLLSDRSDAVRREWRVRVS